MVDFVGNPNSTPPPASATLHMQGGGGEGGREGGRGREGGEPASQSPQRAACANDHLPCILVVALAAVEVLFRSSG